MKPKPRPKPVKAYKNATFLNSADARIIRMMCEFVEPLRRFKHQNVTDTVVFFGSSRALPPEQARKDLQRLKRLRSGSRAPESENEIRRLEAVAALAHYYEAAEELAYLLTTWSKSLGGGKKFIICSGGGPGIMEAANRGAARARGRSIGLNISLPLEQAPNQFITDALNFEFHYFFMRKFWFTYLAKALICFPGGFGTMDELMEILTLVQTRKLTKPMPIVVYGSDYWSKIIRFEELVARGTIDPPDVNLFKYCDSPREAFEYLREELTKYHLGPEPHPFHRPTL